MWVMARLFRFQSKAMRAWGRWLMGTPRRVVVSISEETRVRPNVSASETHPKTEPPANAEPRRMEREDLLTNDEKFQACFEVLELRRIFALPSPESPQPGRPRAWHHRPGEGDDLS